MPSFVRGWLFYKEVNRMSASAIILGAGKGVRMHSATPKQFLRLKNLPIIAYSLKAFSACDEIAEIYLVVSADESDFCRHILLPSLNLAKPVKLLTGGERRQDSVYNGLREMGHREGIVAIHDGVRPFVQPAQIGECIAQAEKTGACMLGMPVGDTLKRVNDSGIIKSTVQRDNLWQAQTPQAFRYQLIRKAHESAADEGFSGTDDASLVERYGGRVKVIRGSGKNIKITHPDDLGIAQAFLDAGINNKPSSS
ncbi:MAG: 2-C-methyl-D-erythritol 4-phosphate cytidylyltransferase [Deltaproteobacteria bacterium]|nr:2-C-methyl-D-erythritol 4-phosphate cytidylyltransferase [Deltaproteobacteria bacterium]